MAILIRGLRVWQVCRIKMAGVRFATGCETADEDRTGPLLSWKVVQYALQQHPLAEFPRSTTAAVWTADRSIDVLHSPPPAM